MRGQRALLLAPLLACALAAPAQAASGFRAGAAREITTPPAAGTAAGAAADAQFAPELARCPPALFPDRGRFALQEPFVDLNHNGQWDDQPQPEPFCDANGNGRWDGIYTSGQNDVPATGVHDDLDVRAVAIARGTAKPLVIASVVQQGLFDSYTDAMRARLHDAYGIGADLVVSADHNESSPDSIGIYGAAQTPAGAGLRSGIDEYYMRFLEDRVARAAATAVRRLAPARLYAAQEPLPPTISQRYSEQFPTFVATTAEPHVPAAIDTKLGVLQARTPAGAPIFTVLSYAAHNQEMGRVGGALSADWPGAFATAFDAAHPGMAMFLVGDNGSQEDPQTNPPVIPNGSENHGPEQYVQAQATGQAFADAVSAEAQQAVPLRTGAVTLRRVQFCVPLQNDGFLALDLAGVFGMRQAYACAPDGTPLAALPSGNEFRTYVSVAAVGPDLQLIANPGEAFPALMMGSPFGKETESCDRPDPPVPTWHARAPYRFQVGLADDMIGYMLPGWAFADSTPGLFPTTCVADSSDRDANGHQHKLESESVGWTAAYDVASRLTGLLDRTPDRTAHISDGRYVLADGTLSHRPQGAVGILLASGRVVAVAGVSEVGSRRVDATGQFMDYDGLPQPGGPDVNTRGMLVRDHAGRVRERDYVRVFDPLPAR
ncbi:MAG TPA: hypothetical protein VFT42_06060 [Solirubrobacteraceae bacterium]|nr:hypothetical protein [Solirubrobacteraceae bacterium]